MTAAVISAGEFDEEVAKLTAFVEPAETEQNWQRLNEGLLTLTRLMEQRQASALPSFIPAMRGLKPYIARCVSRR